MTGFLGECEVFEGLNTQALSRLMAVAQSQTYEAGEHAFLLGQEAEHVYVVREGSIDMCLPVAVRGEVEQVPVETKGPGSAIGWSALVSPYRFRLSARAAERCELAAFPRKELLRLFDDDPRSGYVFLRRIADIIGGRLLKVQALWARELQRTLSGGLAIQTPQPPTESPS